MKIYSLATFVLLGFTACGGSTANLNRSVPPPNKAAPSPMPTAMPEPKNGDYPGRGKVTKINMNLGSVELDHEEIVGVMAPMIMEFYVSDKAMLTRVNVGDQVDFTLKYKDGSETIVKIVPVKR